MERKTPQSAGPQSAVKVVEVNPRSFGQRYGQQPSRDAVEQLREVIRQARTEHPAPAIATIPATPVPAAIPTSIPAIPKPQQKIKAAAYARVSTLMDSQQTSMEAQRQHFEEEIRANPDYEFAGVYLEAGVTGTKSEIRPELQRLLKDCKDGHIDLVLTKSISRLARNLTDCLEIVRTLKDLGVAIYFEREKIDTGKMGSEFILSMYACLAEEESHSISGNVKWSIRKRFQDGTYQQPLLPYGYERKDGKFVVNKEEATIVRRIYDMVLCGNGMRSIARTLNEEQIPSPSGGQWNPSTLRHLVANPVYMGDMLYQKTYMDEHFQQVKNNGELDQYYDADHHEPIISKETFENAQNAVAQRAKSVGYTTGGTVSGDDAHRSSQHYPFTGILRCRACGTTMHRQVWKGTKNSTWICHKHVMHPDLCLMKPQSDIDLKRAFVNCVNKLAWSQKSTIPEHRLLDQYEMMLGKTEVEKNEARLQEIDAKLKRNCQEARKLMAEVMRERFRPEHREKKARLDQEEKQLLTEKNHLLIHGAGNGTLQELKKFVAGWRISESAESFPEEAFSNFVEDCVVLSGKMVTFQFRCGLKLTESLYKVELPEATPPEAESATVDNEKKSTNNKEVH